MKDHNENWKVEKANSFRMEQCDNPKCGAHLIAVDILGNDICDITITVKAGASVVKALQMALYKKATEQAG